MNVFISSVVNEFEQFRTAARVACETLDLDAIMSENFGARPYPSEVACLTEVEHADVFVLMLGEKYGFEQAPGESVTQQEFRHAIAYQKPVLVFIHSVAPDDPRQIEFQREVSEYHSGFCREKFTTPEELTQKIVQNLVRLGKQKSACSQAEFASRLQATSSDISNYQRQYDATFLFAFFPQPQRSVLLVDKAAAHDETFVVLCSAGLAEMKAGYTAVDKPHFTGLDAGKTSVRFYEDGLIILKTSASSWDGRSSFSNWYVPPTKLASLAAGCFPLIPSNGGWCRIGLEGMDHAVIQEPPSPATSSFSMPHRRENSGLEDKLFIPLTQGGFAEWTKVAIQKLQRRFSI